MISFSDTVGGGGAFIQGEAFKQGGRSFEGAV